MYPQASWFVGLFCPTISSEPKESWRGLIQTKRTKSAKVEHENLLKRFFVIAWSNKTYLQEQSRLPACNEH